MKVAVLQLADVGPLDSTVQMLQYADYRCLLCSKRLQGELRRIGCDTVLDVDDLVRSGSYDQPAFDLGRADDLVGVDLYCDVKAHRSYNKVVARWPNLKGKILWTRINGAAPEHAVNERGDHGDEVNPPCPVLTPNQWYKDRQWCKACNWSGPGGVMFFTGGCPQCGALNSLGPPPWADKAYAMWPPFVRWGDYYDKHGRPDRAGAFLDPVCLVHNLKGWGYGPLAEPLRALGILLLGEGSPDGSFPHRRVPQLLSQALAYAHLKSNDAPGYALYEAMAAGCPVVVPRRLIWRCRMGALLEEGVTCFCFDRETHDPLSPEDVEKCAFEIRFHLEKLRTPRYNRELGLAGRERLKSVMWREERDGPGFRAFMERAFP